MSYAVKEIYYTLQGEGANAGRPAVFLRFAGCNLWSGREADREHAICGFCDTDFVGTDGPGGGSFPAAAALARAVAVAWPRTASSRGQRFVVCTVRAGDELKLVFPQEGAAPEHYAALEFRQFFLQPMDGPERERNTQLAVRYCLQHPQWRLSLQTHKLLGIP